MARPSAPSGLRRSASDRSTEVIETGDQSDDEPDPAELSASDEEGLDVSLELDEELDEELESPP